MAENKPDLDNKTNEKTHDNQPTLTGYEELKKRNRSRLLGAGAMAFLAGGLTLIVASNDAPESPILDEASRPVAQVVAKSNTTEVLLPEGVSASQASGVSETIIASDVASASAENVDSSPATNVASKQTSNNGAEQPVPDGAVSAENLTAMVSPEPLKQPSAAEKRRLAREAQQREREQREAQRAADERAREQRRREAQAVTARIEAERAAQNRIAAERTRQAQLAAEQKRQQERAQWLAKQAAQRAQETQSAARGTQKQPAPAVATSASGKVMVQVGAYSTRALAQQVQTQLRGMGYNSQIEPVKTANGTMYRVRATGFANRAAATQAANQLKSRGLGGMIIEQK